MASQGEASTDRARKLRREDTVAEQRLWEALRNRRLDGVKFVRQLPIGPYVVDFACREYRLVVEVDGASHSELDEIESDKRRTTFLHERGWCVMRCWNQDVFENLSGVCDSILLALHRQ